MSERHTVAMQLLVRGPRADEAIRELAVAVPGSSVREPDETGIFEIDVDAAGFDQALHTIWNAVAATGVDDRIAFAEHPSIPEHWRPRTAAPRS
jgi:hypothetical protein